MEKQEYVWTWMRGWKDAACAMAKRRAFVQHPKQAFRETYDDGYEAGFQARAAAQQAICHRIGYIPNVLRAAPSGHPEGGGE